MWLFLCLTLAEFKCASAPYTGDIVYKPPPGYGRNRVVSAKGRMMTDELKDNPETQDDDINAQANDELYETAEDDPIIQEMREAEKELEGAKEGDDEEQKTDGDGEGEGEKPKSETKKEDEGSEEGDQKAKSEEDNSKEIMIPKSRLDQVLSERDFFKNQTNYLKGIVDARGNQATDQNQKPQGEDKGQEQRQDEPTLQDRIQAEEDRVLDAADQYEKGDISLKEFETIRIKSDRAIRTIENEVQEAKFKETQKDMEGRLSQSEMKAALNDFGKQVQSQHPYVAKIDALPEGIRNGIWQEIGNQAATNLAQRGINVQDGSLKSRMAFIQEKAALTNEYGPRWAGQIEDNNSQEDPAGKKEPSERARQREEKLNLADMQPSRPESKGASEAAAELTEADIENMDEDEIADMLQRAPSLVKKATGLKEI